MVIVSSLSIFNEGSLDTTKLYSLAKPEAQPCPFAEGISAALQSLEFWRFIKLFSRE